MTSVNSYKIRSLEIVQFLVAPKNGYIRDILRQGVVIWLEEGVSLFHILQKEVAEIQVLAVVEAEFGALQSLGRVNVNAHITGHKQLRGNFHNSRSTTDVVLHVATTQLQYYYLYATRTLSPIEHISMCGNSAPFSRSHFWNLSNASSFSIPFEKGA